MILNQATQIANQIRQMSAMTGQITKLEEQLDHMREAARGEVDALTDPFADLAAGTVDLVSDGLDWSSEFRGGAGELVRAVREMGSSGGSFTDVWRAAQARPTGSARPTSSSSTATVRPTCRPEPSRTSVARGRPPTARGCSTTR